MWAQDFLKLSIKGANLSYASYSKCRGAGGLQLIGACLLLLSERNFLLEEHEYRASKLYAARPCTRTSCASHDIQTSPCGVLFNVKEILQTCRAWLG